MTWLGGSTPSGRRRCGWFVCRDTLAWLSYLFRPLSVSRFAVLELRSFFSTSCFRFCRFSQNTVSKFMFRIRLLHNHINIYIYIYIEREIDIDIDIHVSIYIYIIYILHNVILFRFGGHARRGTCTSTRSSLC